MKKLILLISLFLLSSCMEKEFSYNREKEIEDNIKNIFGVDFPKTQNWCTAVNSSIKVHTAESTTKVQVLLSNVNDSISYLTLLNQSKVKKDNETISLTFDTPDTYTNLFIAFIDNNGQYFYKKFNIGDEEVYFEDKIHTTRAAASQNYTLPTNSPIIEETVESFASQRGWLPGEKFYIFENQSIEANDYDETFKEVFRSVIFNYFPNGRKYDNLPKIKKSGYYNESAYPITTGDEPIIVSPVYKNDGGYYEISEAELYYYYFKGDLSREEIEALPKYKALQLSDLYTNEDNNRIGKSKSYVLAYWGDEIPEVGVEGSYQFPEGYKIGFMYKSNTTHYGNKRQGELYCDGRLNYNINNYYDFKNSKLDSEDPRMAWMSVNSKMFLCVESGTDKDFNDLIVEVEGGIKPIIIIPDEPEKQFYTFCYEDQRLGDYDMNDIVFKGTRLDETHVEWTLMATGAMDQLYIYNIEGENIKSTIEVHDIFGKPGQFVNTSKNDNTPYITDIIEVNKNYSFLDVTTQPYIYDKSKNWYVKIAKQGEDPHAIMIPYDFRWPLERICIKDAYSRFNEWGQGIIEETDWYKFPNEEKVY